MAAPLGEQTPGALRLLMGWVAGAASAWGVRSPARTSWPPSLPKQDLDHRDERRDRRGEQRDESLRLGVALVHGSAHAEATGHNDERVLAVDVPGLVSRTLLSDRESEVPVTPDNTYL